MSTPNRFIMLILLILFDLNLSSFSATSQSLTQNSLNKIDDLDTADTIFLSQSETCTQDDNSNRIQCFREIPAKKYEVFEGDDILIRCRVAYQKGKLQWAFKGKMLGFDRSIPNYPRMRMPGNPEIGDHSIFIESVKVSDSGPYECQLSPSASQPPRRRLTELLVLRAPTKPVIYRNGNVNRENISVSIKKDESAFLINLTCVASEGNPSPTFEWSVNDVRLQSAAIFRSGRTQIAMANESASVLSLRSDQIGNNDIITCGVFNAATRKRTNLSERIIVTKIRVLKRILPGPLRFKEILPNFNSITVQEKEQFRLSCMTNDPGEPPIKLQWKSSLADNAITEDMITNSHNQLFSQSTIVITAIDSRWHRGTLYCSGVQDGVTTAKPIAATILVKHLPTKLDLAVISMTTNNTLENPTTVFSKEDQMIRIVCSTNTFFSQSLKIEWFTKYSEESDWKKLSTSREQTIEMDEERLRLLKSVVELTPSLFDKNSVKNEPSKFILNVVCMLKSPELSGELRRQIRLEPYEQPSSPVITMNDERVSAVLMEGQSVKIKCSIAGGHPVPELLLVDESDRMITSRTYYQFSVTSLEYNIEVKHRDNGKKFRCITSSKSTLDYVSLSSDLVTLRVAMPPQTLTMKLPESKYGNRAYQYISYKCHTDSSFPQAKIEWWWYHSCKIQHIKLSRLSRLSSSDIRPFCESVLMEDNHISNFNTATQSTSSTINIKLLPTHDLTFIECLVSRDSKWTTFSNQLSKISQLRVQYLPQFPEKLEKIYTVEEGQNLSIAINASANPTINGYTWLINKQPITSKSQIELKVDQFSVSNVHRDMMGNYTLLLENQLGKNSQSFFLNITFTPKLLGPSTETIKLNSPKDFNQKTVITCSAQANPYRDQAKVQWTKESPMVIDHSDLVNILKGRHLFSGSPQVHCAKDHWVIDNISVDCISLGAIEIVSRLQIMHLDYRFIGSYKCIFTNNVKPASAVKTINLVFPTIPIPIKNQRKSEYAAKIGGKTEIACYFIAFPSPNIVWTRNPNIRCSDNPRKYATSVSSPQAGLIKAVLAIRDTNDSDVGTYNCNAQNLNGKSFHSVSLSRPGAPTQPMNVTVINVTDSSITIGWIPGFNGGSKQTFELRWRPYDIGQEAEFSFLELSENDESDVQIQTMNDLQSHREYEFLIQATNRYTSHPGNPVRIIIKTLKFGDESEKDTAQRDDRINLNKSNKGQIIQDKSETNNILIIILLSTIGGLLIGLKIGLVAYFVRKRHIKQRKSMDKMSSPTSQRMTDGFLNSADSMEMRAPSLVRSGIESNLYAQSISDHMSQNGSDNGLKLNYYKTTSDEFQQPYLSPELDLVASAMGRNNFVVPSNFHPAYIQLAESSSLTGYPEPYITGYYTHKPVYHNQAQTHQAKNTPNHSAIDPSALPQYPVSSNFQKRPENNNYPSSGVSMSTASGESNRSRSPNRKYLGYSPLIGQSGAPSTVEEYLSSANSGSEYHRFCPNGTEEYVANPMSSFRLNQKDYYNGTPTQDQISTQESILEIPSHKMNFDNGMDFHYPMLDDRLRLSMTSENEQLLKPPINFSGSSNVKSPQKINEISKLNYVDLISHSSPSVIRITGTMSENL